MCQEMMGLQGGLIILEPDQPDQPDKPCSVHRDYFVMFQEFHVEKQPMHGYTPGVYDLDPYNMD